MADYFKFDYFNQFEIPNISLANPDLTPLYNLGNIYDRSLKLRFNNLSEFSFIADKYQNGTLNPYYDYLDYRRIVSIDGLGHFMIVSKSEHNDGISQYKEIGCQSIETELNFKKLSLFKGTYKFWDLLDPEPTLMGYISQYLPGWTIGDIDDELNSLYRTFDISDTTIYSFLMNDVSQAYQCIFTFDYLTRTINAHTVTLATTATDIYLSYDNLIENIKIEEITEELVTALNVFGGGNLDIRTVNPLGTNTIYNFDYYKNPNWMSGSLITALTNWENAVSVQQPTYADLLTFLKNLNVQIIDKEAEISLLHTAPYPDGLDALLSVQAVRIQQGLPIDSVNALILAKQSQISIKEGELVVLEDQKSEVNDALEDVNVALSWDSNFTPELQEELSRYIIGSTYTNPNLVKNDLSTNVEIQETSQTLYDQAVTILAKISEPRYTFSIEAANFVFLKEFQAFINQIELGCVVTIEFDDGNHVYPALLGMDFSYDEPEQFKLIFSNRLRLDDAAFQFSDLFNQSVDSGVSTDFNSELWSSWVNYSKSDVTEFINSALDASKNAVINASNQSIIIDSSGLRARYMPGGDSYDVNGNLLTATESAYSPEQLWMINNSIVFTDDNWNSAKMAIGKIQTPTSGSVYGIAADVIAGRLIAGNDLIISNDKSSFIVSGSLATLTDAVLTIQNANTKITLDPTDGIAISKITNGGLDRKFYTDTNGNVIFAGHLAAASGCFVGEITAGSGKIGSWTIDDRGLKDDGGNYIYGDGEIRLGAMRISGEDAWFDGNIYAKNLNGLINQYQIGSINADTIIAGIIRGINIFGSKIYWGHTEMLETPTGVATIRTDDALEINVGNVSGMYLSTTMAFLTNPVNVILGSGGGGGRVTFKGSIYVNNKMGITGTFLV